MNLYEVIGKLQVRIEQLTAELAVKNRFLLDLKAGQQTVEDISVMPAQEEPVRPDDGSSTDERG